MEARIRCPGRVRRLRSRGGGLRARRRRRARRHGRGGGSGAAGRYLDLDRGQRRRVVLSRTEAAANHRALGIDRTLLWQRPPTSGRGRPDVGVRLPRRAACAPRSPTASRAAWTALWAYAMPTTPCAAPPVEDAERYLEILADRDPLVTDRPAGHLGALRAPRGLPIGLQLVRGQGRDHLLVALGRGAGVAAVM